MVIAREVEGAEVEVDALLAKLLLYIIYYACAKILLLVVVGAVVVFIQHLTKVKTEDIKHIVEDGEHTRLINLLLGHRGEINTFVLLQQRVALHDFEVKVR